MKISEYKKYFMHFYFFKIRKEDKPHSNGIH